MKHQKIKCKEEQGEIFKESMKGLLAHRGTEGVWMFHFLGDSG